MHYVITAMVYRGTEIILSERQSVWELTEAFSEQRRWLTWWETEGQYEPTRVGWTSIDMQINRRMV